MTLYLKPNGYRNVYEKKILIVMINIPININKNEQESSHLKSLNTTNTNTFGGGNLAIGLGQSQKEWRCYTSYRDPKPSTLDNWISKRLSSK